MKRHCVQIDLDGTLCNIDHRLHHVQNGRKDWTAFFEGIPYDKPNDPVKTTAWLHRWYGYDVVFLSGRSEDYRKYTEKWLDEHFGGNYYLYMRASKDFRSDAIVKRKLFDQYVEPNWHVYFVIDDRPQVCNVWREKNLFLFDVGNNEENDFNHSKKGDLHVFIGPSGSGKTTLINQLFNRDLVVSSDRVRELVLDDWADQSQNDYIFKVVHELTKNRVNLGLPTVVDATNIKRKDRVALVNLVDNNTNIIYHVVNRSVEDKKQTGGWRNNVHGLIEKHENTFNSNLKDILNGDGFANVTVYDHRK